MLLTALMSAALAGDLVVDASVPVEVRVQGETLVSVLGPARVRVPDFPAGKQAVELVRGGKTQTLAVTVPDVGTTVVTVNDKGGLVEARPGPPPTAPSLELRAPADQRFATILDGQRVLLWSGAHPVLLESLTVGERALELRSPDLLTIWARGALTLQPEDRLVVTMTAGRSADVQGRTGAFRPGAGSAVPPGSGD